MTTKNSITQYTELEFLNFMKSIFAEHSAPTDEKLDHLLAHFRSIVEHPERMDLIYYSADENCNPEAITRIIKEWLAENGKPGFKES